MTEPRRKMMPLAMIKANQENPRIISESKLKKLTNSLLVFPKMMSLRPITLDDDNRVLGGNMRLTALGRIAQMSPEDLRALLSSLPEFDELPDGGREVLAYWDAFTKNPQAEVQETDFHGRRAAGESRARVFTTQRQEIAYKRKP